MKDSEFFFSMTTLENGHRNHDSTTLDHIQ